MDCCEALQREHNKELAQQLVETPELLAAIELGRIERTEPSRRRTLHSEAYTLLSTLSLQLPRVGSEQDEMRFSLNWLIAGAKGGLRMHLLKAFAYVVNSFFFNALIYSYTFCLSKIDVVFNKSEQGRYYLFDSCMISKTNKKCA
jgi:hypothetical protein